MRELLSYLNDAFTLSFVVTSMFGLGLGLTVRQIVEPLRNLSLVLRALAANFVIVPLVAYLLTRILPLELDLQIGLLLLACVAGAPLALKASEIARGDVVLSVSLVTLLVVATVIYLPLVLPLLIPGIAVDTVAIAIPLILQILVPLALGLLMNVRYDLEAEMTRPIIAEISNISLALLLVVNLVNLGEVFSLLGTGAILAVLLILAVGLAAGYFLGGSETGARRTVAITTAQRNYAAAFVIAAGNFAERPDVFLMLLTASLISMIFILVVAGEFRRRTETEAAAGALLVKDKQTSQS